MSGEAEIVAAVIRIGAALAPAIEAALRGGESEEQVIARLSGLATPIVRDTTIEDAQRRARLIAAHAAAVSHEDLDRVTFAANDPATGSAARASMLRVLDVARAVKLEARSDEPTGKLGPR